jgi:protein SCO1/2
VARRLRHALVVSLGALALVAGMAGSSRADDPGHAPSWDEASALQYSQAAVGRTAANHRFLNRDGHPVRLADYRGKPLVVNLIYTSCYHICPLIVQTLARAVAVAQEALGEDSFAVVTVGFDVKADTPERMRAYAHSQGIDLANWAFLSSDAKTIERFVADVGFVFFSSAKGYDHLIQTTVIDAEGRVYRQIYGEQFDPPALVEPLKQLVFGRRSDFTTVSGLINRIRLFCTIYDPSGQRYRFDYSFLIGLAVGVLSLTGLAAILGRAWLRVWRGRHALSTRGEDF